MLSRLRLQKITTFVLKLNSFTSSSNLNKRPNLYNLLEVKPTAKPEQIQYSYYRLIKKYRPDPNSDPQKHAKLLNEAYILLSNPKLREKYDKENGFVKDDDAQNKKQKEESQTFSGNIDSERQYKKARAAFAAIIGDKAARQQNILLTIVAFGVFLGTLTLLFSSDPKDKKKKPGLFDKSSQQSYKRELQNMFKGKVA